MAEMGELITASNGRKYIEKPDGKLVPVFDAALHAQGQLQAITDKHTITGLRVVDSADPDSPAVVVTFTADEELPVLAAVKGVLKARTGE